MAQEKRVNYFQGMMLVDQDFKDDQYYHRQMRHNHNLELHTWGVVRGLDVSIDKTVVSVTEGVAIDATGKEIRWTGGAIQAAGSAADGSYLVVESAEELRDVYPQMTGKYLRVIDIAKFSWKSAKADNDVVLAVLTQGQPDPSVRRNASSVRVSGNSLELRPLSKDGSLRVMIGASERMTIGPTGNVGIGTTDPQARLHLKFPDVARGNAAVLNLEGTDHVYMQFFPLGFAGGRKAWMGYESANEKNFKIKNEYPDAHLLLASGSGKVGIGTSKPGFTLQVGDTDNVVDARLCVAGRGDTGNFRQWTLRTGDKVDATSDAAKTKEIHKLRIRDEQGNADRLVINQEGSVGIGLTDPQNPLEVRGSVAIRSGILKFMDEKGDWYPDNWIGMSNSVEGTLATKWLHVGGITDASARRVALYADITYVSGKLGIGTTSPYDKLQVGDGYSRICINPSPKGTDQNLYDADYGTSYLGLNVIKATNKWHRDGDGTTNNGASLIYNTIKGQLCFVTLEPGAADLNAADVTSRKRMVIDENGVGIGTSDPGSSKLKIAKSATDFVNYRFVETGMGQLEIVGWSQGWNINAMTNEKNLYLNRDSAERSNVLIGRSGKELFVRGSNGSVGIGTSDPQAKLMVRGDERLVQLGNFWTFGESSKGEIYSSPSVKIANAVAPGDTVEMAGVRRVVSVVSDTNLTTSPSFPYNAAPIPVYVVRPASPFRADNYKGTQVFSISGEGDAAIAGRISCGGWIAFKTWHGSYVTANDDRATMRQNPTRQTWEQFTLEMACSRELKENISDISVEEAMTTLEALNPIRYDYKGQKAFRQNLGFIAEEMPDNLASEDRKSVSPFEVIPVLTRVAKEQQKTIARLQETIRALQEEVRRNLVSTVPTTGPILSTNALGE